MTDLANVVSSSTRKCEWCNKVVTKKNFSRHKNVCVSRPEIPQDKSNQSTVADMEIIVMQAVKKALAEERANLTQECSTTTNYNNVVIQNNIVMNSFGNEDVAHLNHDFLSHCLLNPTKGITNLIDTIHYNREVPSNHNLRHKSDKKSTYERFDGSHWIVCDTTNTLDELIRKGYRILNTHYMEYFLNDPQFIENENRARALERFRFLSDTNCPDYKSVRRDLRCLVKDKTMYVLQAP